MDAAYYFAKNFIETSYEKIPQDTVEMVKKDTLDLLGVALAGSPKSGTVELEELYNNWGGKKESTVLCYGSKMPAPYAAQINATMGHALDYDDTHEGAIIHPAVISVPTCLAMAEYKGKLSGREFITTSAVGMDMICRLGLATTSPLRTGWHLTTLNGFVTAAAIASSILGLDENEIVNAIGIAYHQSSGNGQCVIDGALTKRMGPGFAVKGGILAALLAEKGITGSRNSIEGDSGLFKLYHNGIYDTEVLTENLGKYFECVNTSIKPYPCCRATHVYIDAAYALVEKNKLKPEDIKEVIVLCGKLHNNFLCTPSEIKINPCTIVDAQFSTPWVVSTMIAKGKVTLHHFTEEAIKNKDILKISNKIKIELVDDPAITTILEPGKLKILTKNNETYFEKVDYALGSPQRPLSFDQCADKFRDCASYSIKQLSNDTIDHVIELIRNLEDLEDVTAIINLLS